MAHSCRSRSLSVARFIADRIFAACFGFVLIGYVALFSAVAARDEAPLSEGGAVRVAIDHRAQSADTN